MRTIEQRVILCDSTQVRCFRAYSEKLYAKPTITRCDEDRERVRRQEKVFQGKCKWLRPVNVEKRPKAGVGEQTPAADWEQLHDLLTMMKLTVTGSNIKIVKPVMVEKATVEEKVIPVESCLQIVTGEILHVIGRRVK